MDPLSIIASGIAVAGAARLALTHIKDLCAARPDLHALANEISDIEVILHETSRIIQCQKDGAAPGRALVQILETVKQSLDRIALQVAKWDLPAEKTRTLSLARAKQLQWITMGAKVKEFRAEFRDLRSHLIAALSASSAFTSSRIVLNLQEVVFLAERIAGEQTLLQHELRNSLSRHNDGLSSIAAQLASLAPSAVLDPDVSDEGEEYSTKGPIFAGRSCTIESDCPVPSDEPQRGGSKLIEACQSTAINHVSIRAAHFSREPCESWCSCVCHKEHRVRSPEALELFIGALFIGYSGLPVSKRKCNQRSCHLQSPPLAYVTYVFPRWFVARMLSLTFTTLPVAGPVAALKISRTVPADADIFTYAKLGDVDRLQNLFRNRLASANDVHYKTGVTALHFAIAHQRFAVCKLLLQAGADPFLSGQVNRGSAADKAWSRILSNCLPPSGERELRLLFSSTETLERRDFSVLHKIVLKLCNKPLAAELEASTSDLNARDSLGRTPLSLAAERGDAESVAILLEHGADPCIAAYSGSTPLRYAATAANPDCIPLLLKAGADVTSRTDFGQTALHYAAAHNRDPTHTKLLLAAGADPNAADHDGRTPLGFTPIQDHYEVAASLLKKGATIGSEGRGVQPLILAIESNRHRLLELFCKHKPRTDVHVPKGQTIFHAIAATADERTMRLLISLEFSNVSVGQVNDDGLTALELLRQREDYSEKLQEAFNSLLVDQGQEWSHGEDGDEDLDEEDEEVDVGVKWDREKKAESDGKEDIWEDTVERFD